MKLAAILILCLSSLANASVVFGDFNALVHQPCFDPTTNILTPGMQVSNTLVMPIDYHIEYVNYGVRFLYPEGANPTGTLSILMTVEAWGTQYVRRAYDIERHSTIPISVLNFLNMSVYAEAGTTYTFTLTVTGQSEDFNAQFGTIPYGDGFVMTIAGRPIISEEAMAVPEPGAIMILCLASGLMLRRITPYRTYALVDYSS